MFNKQISEVYQELNTAPGGLSQEEAEKRLNEVGYNSIETEEKTNPLKVLIHQFADPLIYILLVAAAFTAIIQHFLDMWVILAVVAVNAVIGFYQEWRAEQAIRSLQKLAAPKSQVLRDGEQVEIESSKLVPGDIVLLESGSRVPADMRLTEENRLEIDEATLTGEALRVSKNTQTIEEKTVPVADRLNMAFMGTLVLAGRGKGIVTATGLKTELGSISEQVNKVKSAPTPLQVQLNIFSQWLGIVILVISLGSVALGLLLGRELFEMILTGTALAVGAIPEGLPVVVTITLAIGVKKMARRNAIVRKLPAVETLGSTSVIASDKTGTLTKNEMTVQQVWTPGNKYHITGVGFEPEGEVYEETGQPTELENHKALEQCLRIGVLSNESSLGYEEDTGHYPQGDPTEVALIVGAAKAGLNAENETKLYPTLDEIPFESELMYMASLHEHPSQEENIIFLKGAPERVTEMCSSIVSQTDGEVSVLHNKEEIYEQAKSMSREGLRVLAMAYKTVPKDVTEISEDMMDQEFTFSGLQGMIDPPRDEVLKAINQAKSAGVRVMMVTGDNIHTATAIGRKLKLIGNENAPTISGKELEEMSDEELYQKIDKVNVFARAAPLHKLRIVKQLINKGEIVAVTGDGVNDTPALKASHIGVAMGKVGTDAAKETSDMIVTDDNFASIFDAVREGRVVYSNVRKVILFLLSSGLAQIFLIFASLLLGMPLPLLPAQILWLNLVSNGLQDLAIAFEPGEKGITDQPPREKNEPVLSSFMIQRLILIGIVIAFGTTYTFSWALRGYDLEHARTIALTTIVLSQLFNVFNVRSLTKSIFKIPFLSNPFLTFSVVSSILAQVAIIYIPALQFIFRTRPLNLSDWALSILIAVTVLIAVELEKLFRASYTRNKKYDPAY